MYYFMSQMSKFGFGEDHTQQAKLQFPIDEQIDNVMLNECSYCSGTSQGGTNWEAVQFDFSRSTGMGTAVLTEKVFAVNESNVKTYGDQTHEEAVANAYRRFNTKLQRIATAFGITIEELRKSCDGCATPKEFIENYCNLVNARSTGKKVWLKTVPNSSGYPKTPNTMFIQMKNDEPCELRWTKGEMEAVNKHRNSSTSTSESQERDW